MYLASLLFLQILDFLPFKIWVRFASCCTRLPSQRGAAPQGERALLGSCCSRGPGQLRAGSGRQGTPSTAGQCGLQFPGRGKWWPRVGPGEAEGAICCEASLPGADLGWLGPLHGGVWDEPLARPGPGSRCGCVRSALPGTFQLADGGLSLSGGAGFSPELLLPKEGRGCNDCRNLLLKFQCQATKSRDSVRTSPQQAAARLPASC